MNNSLIWEAKWASSDGFSPRWGNRGVSPEIVEAVKSGWLPSHGPVLDIGCGLGEIAAWFGTQGYEALGFDIAESAIRRAREMHAPLPPKLEFMVLDACGSPLPNRQYKILIDRGCLHTISPELVATFTRNIVSVAAPDARMLLFMRAFRTDRPFGDRWETEIHVKWVKSVFAGRFKIARYAPTYMDRYGGKQPAFALPGLVFWLVVSEGGADAVPER
jgi:SAM-dependent methyltransferase